MTIRIDDVIAALLLSLIMFRRLEVLGTSSEENPQVRLADFEHWRAQALKPIRVAALACVLKVGLSLLWFRLAPSKPALVVGGLSLFLAWVGTLVWTWGRATEARALKVGLGIVSGRKRPPPSPEAGKDASDAVVPPQDEEAARSRDPGDSDRGNDEH
jgi:hypothetical protein